MKISVITPTFNAAATLEDAVLSVREQQFAGSCEHIVVDGGSTDGTLDIVRKYNHIRYISEPDRGIYDALNKGVEMARGEWLYFLGADDRLYAPDVFAMISDELAEPFKVIYGDVVSERFGGRYGGEYDDRDILRTNICHQAIFFHRAVFAKIGNFDTRYPYLSDWDHNLRWMFDPDLKSKYIGVIIAEYGDEGVSSVVRDEAFYRDRRFNYLRYGRRALPKGRYLYLAGREIFKCLRTGNFRRIPECFKLGLGAVFRRQGGKT